MDPREAAKHQASADAARDVVESSERLRAAYAVILEEYRALYRAVWEQRVLLDPPGAAILEVARKRFEPPPHGPAL